MSKAEEYKAKVASATKLWLEEIQSACNPKISAGEIRSMGFMIEEGIPDCAVVPRESISITVEGVSLNKSTGKVETQLVFGTSAPFEWVQLKGVVPYDKEEKTI